MSAPLPSFAFSPANSRGCTFASSHPKNAWAEWCPVSKGVAQSARSAHSLAATHVPCPSSMTDASLVTLKLVCARPKQSAIN